METHNLEDQCVVADIHTIISDLEEALWDATGQEFEYQEHEGPDVIRLDLDEQSLWFYESQNSIEGTFSKDSKEAITKVLEKHEIQDDIKWN